MAARKADQIFQTIDAREWQPPEPMLRTLEALDLLPKGQKLIMLIHSEPRPLFRILKLNGFDYRCKFIESGYFEVIIWHAEDTSATSASLE